MNMMFSPSYYTDAYDTFEDLDKLAMRKFLVREKICENFEDITAPAKPPKPSSNVSYWDKSVHIIELIWYHLKRHSNHEENVEATKLSSEQQEYYTNNIKNLKALCREGNHRSLMLCQTPLSVAGETLDLCSDVVKRHGCA
jgi:hypothetical protein